MRSKLRGKQRSNGLGGAHAPRKSEKHVQQWCTFRGRRDPVERWPLGVIIARPGQHQPSRIPATVAYSDDFVAFKQAHVLYYFHEQTCACNDKKPTSGRFVTSPPTPPSPQPPPPPPPPPTLPRFEPYRDAMGLPFFLGSISRLSCLSRRADSSARPRMTLWITSPGCFTPRRLDKKPRDRTSSPETYEGLAGRGGRRGRRAPTLCIYVLRRTLPWCL